MIVRALNSLMLFQNYLRSWKREDGKMVNNYMTHMGFKSPSWRPMDDI